MKTISIEDNILKTVVEAMAKSEMFGQLNPPSLEKIARRAVLSEYDPDEIILEENCVSDSFLMILKGEVAILHHHVSSDEVEEIGRMKPYDIIGEIGLLLNMHRTARVTALQPTLALKFDTELFTYMFDNIPKFGLSVSKNLAMRLQRVSSFIPLSDHDIAENPPSEDALKLLPLQFVIRHRVMPIDVDGNVLKIGFVNDPTPYALSAVRRFLPGMELRVVHVDHGLFDEVLRSQAGIADWQEEDAGERPVETVWESKSPRLDQMLQRVVEEGASDLHLSAGHVPHWRIDGDIKAIADLKTIGSEEVRDLLLPIMNEKKQREFEEELNADFVYAMADTARFRVNIFMDENGVCAALRCIPSKIMTFEQLGLPKVLKKLCEHPKGLVLVTGPTGSGKSTTLAAMIDHINKTRRAHIITMEDPIEFAHRSDKSLINQREIGRHAKNFSTALRAGLREDPDIIMVGEMRDLETMALALETANTGHLVFGTLHTATAISTMTRLIDAFPPDQQNQVRTSLADSLRGVIAQALCRCIGGGRAAAFEILVLNAAVSNLIREEKYNQIASYIQTGRDQGNRTLNEELFKLVRRKKIDPQEAMSKASDKEDLAKKLEMM